MLSLGLTGGGLSSQGCLNQADSALRLNHSKFFQPWGLVNHLGAQWQVGAPRGVGALVGCRVTSS